MFKRQFEFDSNSEEESKKTEQSKKTKTTEFAKLKVINFEELVHFIANDLVTFYHEQTFLVHTKYVTIVEVFLQDSNAYFLNNFLDHHSLYNS